jgi:hypothetical protein
MYISIKEMTGEEIEEKKTDSVGLLTELEKLKNNQVIELDPIWKITNDILQNFALVFLEYVEKKGNKKNIDVEIKTKYSLKITFEIDFFDVFVASDNQIRISDNVVFSCGEIEKVFIFDGQLMVFLADNIGIYFN